MIPATPGPRRHHLARKRSEAGYNMVMLIVALTVLNIMIAAMMPLMSTEIQREKEEELVFRGFQYAEAIRIFHLRFQRFPNKLEELIEIKPRCIRQLWKDPMTKDGKWGLIFQGQGVPLNPRNPQNPEGQQRPPNVDPRNPEGQPNNDGRSPADLSVQFKQWTDAGVGTNVAAYYGEGTLRGRVVGNLDVKATPAQIEEMKRLVSKAMDDGALGLSTGLFYAPGSFAPTEEIIELAKVAGAKGGIYDTHMGSAGASTYPFACAGPHTYLLTAYDAANHTITEQHVIHHA